MRSAQKASLSRNLFCSLLAASLTSQGCATTVPYTGVGPHPQIERGAPNPIIDFLGNFLALPSKLFLLSWKFDQHYISPETEDKLVHYLDQRKQNPVLTNVKFRLNQYRPIQDLSRLIHNRHMAWPYRLLLGLPITLIIDVLLPGRLLPWGDYYNPYTNTAHLYSDHPAIMLHEAGHAYDFGKKKFKGTYAILRLIPFVDLYQEYKATDQAFDYLIEIQDRETEVRAIKILYPAYATYIAGYLGYFGGLAVFFSHIYAQHEADEREDFYQALGYLLPPGTRTDLLPSH